VSTLVTTGVAHVGVVGDWPLWGGGQPPFHTSDVLHAFRHSLTTYSTYNVR